MITGPSSAPKEVIFESIRAAERISDRIRLFMLAESCFDGKKQKRFKKKIIRDSLRLINVVGQINTDVRSLYAGD